LYACKANDDFLHTLYGGEIKYKGVKVLPAVNNDGIRLATIGLINLPEIKSYPQDD